MLRRGAAVALVVAVIAVVASAAHAERIVAITPLSTLGTEDTSASTRQLTAAIEQAVGALAGTRVIGAAQVAEAIKKAKKPALRVCEGEAACLTELGKLVGAQIVIAGEVGGLGESRVVYLRANDVVAGKELRSTTLAVGANDDGGGPDGAVVRLLEPDRYRGTLRFAIDVTGATIYVNGSRTTATAKGDLALPVGTQAIRVTHPEYRDFVRFIPVKYGTIVDVAVGMQAYPVVERDLQGKPINRDQIRYVDPPVWRRWYVVGGAAVGLAILAGVVAGVLTNDLPDAPCEKVGGGSC